MSVALSPKQLSSVRDSKCSVNVWDGAIRSGKTIGSLLRWLGFVAVAPSGGVLVVVARTRDSAYRNVFMPLMDAGLFGPLAKQVSYTSGAPTARILGKTVFVLGASDAKAEKVVRGLTVAGAYVDEITVIPEEFFTQLLGRMSVTGAKLFGTTNPDSPAHWFKVKFLDRYRELGWSYFHFTMDDNPTLKRSWIEQKNREFTGLWNRRFIKGEWVAAEGAIYDMWDPDRHVVPWETLPQMQALLAIGLDFGTNHATSGIILGLSREGTSLKPRSRLYLVDEFRRDRITDNVTLAPSQMAAEFKAWLPAQHLPYETALRPETIYADPAAKHFRQELNVNGIGNQRAVNDVAYGIGMVASLLAEGHLAVSDRCQGFIKEAAGYSWDPKATAAGKDEPIKVADDSLDAGRYAIASTEFQWRDEITWYDLAA
ncbi:PBSX family phage terminase large subunit [Gryllotalpicola koreensis]|uniref:PBSX family phage terminase large subunit n=1 Tax=Gryllotalpicola koreensis TaxID=993086 RepID=A0ABP8A2W0_9MICO